jgi:hypothetical protein
LKMATLLKPLLPDVNVRIYKGRYTVQVEIPSCSTLTQGDIDTVGSIMSWDVNPNDVVEGYEGIRSVVVSRKSSISKKGIELGSLQISGVGHREFDMRTGIEMIDNEAQFQPPTTENFMDIVTGTKMSTSYAENGEYKVERPDYSPLGTYTFPRLRNKLLKTIEISKFELETLVVPHVEAYGRYVNGDLQNEDGNFGGLVFPVPTGISRASEELQKEFLSLAEGGASLIGAALGLNTIGLVKIFPLIKGLRELHEQARIVHLQTHTSNYYDIQGLAYLMDWGEFKRLGKNREDNIMNRVVDIKRPRDDLEKLTDHFFGRVIDKEAIMMVGYEIIGGVLEIYSENLEKGISLIEIMNRCIGTHGKESKEVDMVIQWMKDQGYEGFPEQEYEPLTVQEALQGDPFTEMLGLALKLTTKRMGVKLPETMTGLATEAMKNDEAARKILRPQKPIKNEQPRIRRNDPCPCDSGKKFKKCCGSGND